MLATEPGWRALLTSFLALCFLRTAHWLPTGFAQRTPGGFRPFPIVPCLPPRQVLSGQGGKTFRELAFIPHSLCPLCPLTPEPEGLQALQPEPTAEALCFDFQIRRALTSRERSLIFRPDFPHCQVPWKRQCQLAFSLSDHRWTDHL